MLLEPLASGRAAVVAVRCRPRRTGVGSASWPSMPFEVTWIDPRAELLPEPLPDNVHPLCSQAPTNTVHLAPAGAASSCDP